MPSISSTIMKPTSSSLNKSVRPSTAAFDASKLSASHPLTTPVKSQTLRQRESSTKEMLSHGLYSAVTKSRKTRKDRKEIKQSLGGGGTGASSKSSSKNYYSIPSVTIPRIVEDKQSLTQRHPKTKSMAKQVAHSEAQTDPQKFKGVDDYLLCDLNED
mmetsp:Transcript_12917/g.20019  ORF Transcript_12917/g.20019 Transcript_12917/m.20019 type:complete len:158 (+) Transcript_12917:137-610(+)